jgi:selenocysteine-specific translation elongation factor
MFSGRVCATLLGGIGGRLGRVGTESDIALFNFKLGDCVLSFVQPVSYPDRIQPLISSLQIADTALLDVSSLDASFAESVVALDCAGLKSGFIVCPDDGVYGRACEFMSGTVCSGFERLGDQVAVIRERLASDCPRVDGPALVQIDHSFQVRGVGTVALGVVKRGVLSKYDRVSVCPGGKSAVVKSIQVHDIDVPEAGCGVRVGLALKDAAPEDVSRGSVLSADGDVGVLREFRARVSLSRFAGAGLREGGSLMLSSFLGCAPAKVVEGCVEAGGSADVVFACEKGLVDLPGPIVLLDPGLKPPRVFGSAFI